MQEHYVETPEQLEALCKTIRTSSWLALDTEFMREKTYYPKLCLLQVCDGNVAACVDPLRLKTLTPLLEIIMDPAIRKIFHAGRQDLEIFHHLWGHLPAPVFDTQLSASLLGLGEQVGYANLVQQILGVELSKAHTRADWSKRPLQEGQLRYALDDVVYLGEMYLEIERRLTSLGRNHWMEEEFRLLADSDTYTQAPNDAWRKIRGIQRMKRSQLVVLQALAAWRENQAIKMNRPRRWLVKDEVLVELARRQPAELGQMEGIRGIESDFLKRESKQLLQLIKKARALPQDTWPSIQSPAPKLNPNEEALVDLLQCSLRLLAAEQQMTPAAFASRKNLELLVSGHRDLELLRGWRKMLVGNQLLQVMAGELVPRVENGALTLVRSHTHHKSS